MEDDKLVNKKLFGMMLNLDFKKEINFGLTKASYHLPVSPTRNIRSPDNDKEHKLWDFNSENLVAAEHVEWLNSPLDEPLFDFSETELDNWIVHGPQITSIANETEFVCADILQKIIKAKGITEQMNSIELCKARSRANPFESIRSVFFMNRAALKMANIDAATGYMFTDIDRNEHHKYNTGPYYFADVCAGPGGFSEYILWRKRWLFKGFGYTLRGIHDFKLGESTCASGATFRPYYGEMGDGDIFRPSNVEDYAEKVRHETDGLGVHFMMADGGFSVDGNEYLQEVLSNQIYACQCLTALEIVRENGHFVTKLFDIFTKFSVGLIYLLYRCFEKFAILKPNSSRPANSERYLICYGRKSDKSIQIVKKYLYKIVEILWRNKNSTEKSLDVLEIVPLDVIKKDSNFYEFIRERNKKIGERQTISLLKLGVFYYNATLVDPRQDILRGECLKFWRIPDKPRENYSTYSIVELLNQACSKPEFLYVQPRKIETMEELTRILSDVQDWHYTYLNCDRQKNVCNIYAGVSGSRVYRLQGAKWVRMKNLQLVKGTLIYGEMVKEQCLDTATMDILEMRSLHVIDAMRLGDISLADLTFNERVDLIKIYCQSVNFETSESPIRLRYKANYPLSDFTMEMENNISILPTIGFNTSKEYYQANSVLFLKTPQSHMFNTTYVLRAQLFLNNSEDETTINISPQDLFNYIKKQL